MLYLTARMLQTAFRLSSVRASKATLLSWELALVPGREEVCLAPKPGVFYLSVRSTTESSRGRMPGHKSNPAGIASAGK